MLSMCFYESFNNVNRDGNHTPTPETANKTINNKDILHKNYRYILISTDIYCYVSGTH